MGTLEFGMGRMVGSIERLDRQMDDQRTLIEAMGERLDGRIDEMGQRLDGRIDEMSQRMDKRFEHVDVRFDILTAQVQKLADIVGDLVSWKQRIWGICLAVSGFASITGLLWALVKTIIQPA
jgi:hypothetical protein